MIAVGAEVEALSAALAVACVADDATRAIVTFRRAVGGAGTDMLTAAAISRVDIQADARASARGVALFARELADRSPTAG
jgi:stage V sporulation protein SpoVS